MEIEGYPNYLIYDDGRVWSKKTNRYLKPYKTGKSSKSQYLCVKLFNDENNRNIRIHRLVAEHYLSNPFNLPTVDHINRDTSDNGISNLRWADYKQQRENQKDYILINSRNKSGYRYIHHDNNAKIWRFNHNKTKVRKCFKNKTDALCYKYIWILRQRAGHYGD